MITFRQHIDLMKYVSAGKGPKDYAEDNFSVISRLDYYRSVEKTYPIKENTKKPTFDKNYEINIEDMVLGQFIMIEQIITGKTKLPDYLIDYEIAKLAIRPKNHTEFDNSDEVEEKNNSEDILDFDVREVYWVLDNLIENRNKILFEDFSGVFYEPNDDEEEEEETNTDKTSEIVFNQQWYWYSIVRMLAGEDIHKYSQTYMLPMRTVLPEMSYLAQRSKIESARQRQEAAMRKL